MKRSDFIGGCLRLSEQAGFCFVPVIGLVFAFACCRSFLTLTRASDERWNPASREMIMGFCCAVAGVFFNLLLILLAALYFYRNRS